MVRLILNTYCNIIYPLTYTSMLIPDPTSTAGLSPSWTDLSLRYRLIVYLCSVAITSSNWNSVKYVWVNEARLFCI